MSDKPQAVPEQMPARHAAGFGALPDHSIIALDGRDAVAFAQAQFMSDVGALASGHWHWSGWLTPKGRVIALFALLRLDDETLWMLVPDADAVALAAQLQRFVFRSKVSIAARDDLAVAGRFAAPETARGARIGGDATTGLELDMGGDDGARTLEIDAEPVAMDAGIAAQWARYDLAHGLPRLDAAQSGHWTPQQLSLDRLKAYSVKKGCYPGQEIVARTHFLGKAKRGLVLVDADGPLEAGMEVRDGDTQAGVIVSAAGSLALAVLPQEQAFNALRAGLVHLRETPLSGGLER